MTRCEKSHLPECEYFTTGGCVSPFNCSYRIEQKSLTTATSSSLNSNVIHMTETCKDKEIARLIAENERLQTENNKIEEYKCVIEDLSTQCRELEAKARLKELKENEELKKKIIDVLQETIEAEVQYYPEDNYTEVVIDCETLADALIEAGIGDMGKYNRLAYEVRCNLTSVTRYIHNKNKQYNKKYKELAEKAVNNLLDLVNNHTQQAEKELAEEDK